MRAQEGSSLPTFEELRARGEAAFAGLEIRDAMLRSDEMLVRFLVTDLDLGKIFASLAERHKQDRHMEDYQRTLNVARRALETVRYFESRVADLDARQDIRARGDELERIVAGL